MRALSIEKYGNIKSSLMLKFSVTIIIELCDVDNLFSLHLCAHDCVNLYESAVGIATMDGGQGLKSEGTVFCFSCIMASMILIGCLAERVVIVL